MYNVPRWSSQSTLPRPVSAPTPPAVGTAGSAHCPLPPSQGCWGTEQALSIAFPRGLSQQPAASAL